jgi:uncharacterized membrane protein YfcA
MASTATPTNHGLTRYWPFGVGGLLGPLFTAFLSRWIRFDVAVGLAMFVVFAAAVWVFQQRSARVPQHLGRALTASFVSGIAAGSVAGGLAFFFPWR